MGEGTYEPSEGVRDEPSPLTRETVEHLKYRAVLHWGECTAKRQIRWRVNGALKTWKTRPEEFRLPIKHGLRDYGYIEQHNVGEFHREEDCPFS